MNTLDRYLSGTVVRAIMLTLLVLTLLIMVLTFVEEAEEVGKGDFAIIHAFLVALYSVPRVIYEAFPVAALIGALLGLGGLASHGELIAMRAAGVSLRHIVFAVVKAGLLMILVVLAVGEFIAPIADQSAEQLKLEKQNKQVTLKTRYGFWAKDGNAFVNIKRILPGERLEDINIYEFSDSGELKLVTQADKAEFSNDEWQLSSVRQSNVSPSGIESRELDRATWSSFLDPGLLNVVVVDPIMLPIWDLYQYAKVMRDNDQNPQSYSVAMWTKLATPLSTLAMLILAVPFVLGSLRSVGMGQRVFFGAMIGSLFYFISKGFSFVAVVYDLYPFTAALFPLLALSAASFYFYRRIT
ncbi:MAG: LPS export ABC transporter permease LptG [bacterium]